MFILFKEVMNSNFINEKMNINKNEDGMLELKTDMSVDYINPNHIIMYDQKKNHIIMLIVIWPTT